MMRKSDVEMPTDRKFGLAFGLIFIVAAGIFWWIDAQRVAMILACLAVVFPALALTVPKVLRPLNYLWFKFGLLLGAIISPIVLAVLYFLLFTPFSLISRGVGRDELRLKKGQRDTYWKQRDPSGPAPDSFKMQY